MYLSQLNINETGIITKVLGRGAFRKRITEMGFIKGKKVTMVKTAPLSDPIEYCIMDYRLSLRRNEAQLIEVITEHELEQMPVDDYLGTFEHTPEGLRQAAKEKGKVINIALVGNPNCGKTTLFNFASNSHEHVGNYSGVTVDSKTARFKHKGYTINIADLPGTYSLTAYSPEELYVRTFIRERMPDIVINVVDASNIERNLYLTTQLIDMDIKVVLALNMFDEMQARGDVFDIETMGRMIGIPIIPTVGSKGIGVRELLDKVINLYSDKDKTYRHVHINYGVEIEESVKKVQASIRKNPSITDLVSSRFLALKLLEKDNDAYTIIQKTNNYNEIEYVVNFEIKRLEKLLADDSETLITDARYGFIDGALKEHLKVGKTDKRALTHVLDTFLTHKWVGFPLFFVFLWAMFQVTFKLGEYPKQWLEQIVGFVGRYANNIVPQGSLNDLLTDGIISGVGGVIVFLPNILLLFLFISFMEDTGYMARVAFIMDKLMHKIGLHGKSFIPLIMGFGCNVPAIMSTRTIENPQNRLLTILINPFMSCSARLPVYILFLAAFFPGNAGTYLFIIYAIGILLAVGVALIFKNTLFKSDDMPFVMELPPYRLPTLKSTLRHMWHKGEQYLTKMGGIILTASVLIWALGYFPRNNNIISQYNTAIANTENIYDSLIHNQNNAFIKDSLTKLKVLKVSELNLVKESELQEKSYIGKIGKTIEPIMQPLGFDWKISVSLLTGIAAKEVVVSTTGVLYQAGVGNGTQALGEKLKQQKFTSGPKTGQPVFTKVTVISLLMFVLIYFPCIAVMAAMLKETGTWKWPLFVVFYTTTLAWGVAYLVQKVGGLF